MTKIGLVFSGGGNKGAYEVGALSYLVDDVGLAFHAVSGVSVGALNALFLGQYLVGEESLAVTHMRDLWNSIKPEKLHRKYTSWSERLVHRSFYSVEPLRKLVYEIIDPAALLASDRELVVGAVHRDKFSFEEFTKNHPHILDAVVASTTIPVLFPPGLVGGEIYIDGGVLNTAPITSLLSRGCNEVYVILTYPPITMGMCLAAESFGVSLSHFLDMYLLSTIKDLDKATVVIRPKTFISSETLNFSPNKLRSLMSQGYTDAKEQLSVR